MGKITIKRSERKRSQITEFHRRCSVRGRNFYANGKPFNIVVRTPQKFFWAKTSMKPSKDVPTVLKPAVLVPQHLLPGVQCTTPASSKIFLKSSSLEEFVPIVVCVPGPPDPSFYSSLDVHLNNGLKTGAITDSLQRRANYP